MNTLMTWQSLTTYAGSVLATGICTQFLKQIRIFSKLPTRLTSYAIALILLLFAEIFTCGVTLARISIIPINAMVVSLASNGAYDAIRINPERPEEGGKKR